jgi:hypothetical protein
MLSSEIEWKIGAIMARRNKLAEQPDSLRTTTLYNKLMVDAMFAVLEEKHILTREEVENCASKILHKACPELKWLQ